MDSIFKKIMAAVSLGLTLSFLLLIGCNNSKNNTSAPLPTCLVGQVATPAGCVPQGYVTPPYGYQPYNNGLVQYYASKTDYLTQKDTLIPAAAYSLFLRDALGVCDRCTTSIGEGIQCSSWVKGFNMLTVNFANNSATLPQMSFYSTPYISQSYFQFAWQFPKIEDFFLTLFTGVPPPSCNPGQFSPYWATPVEYDAHNNGQGFVLYVNNGPFYSKWNLFKFRLYVPVGKIGDPSFDFRITVTDKNGNTQDMATGTLTRCQTPNCGMF